MDDTDVDVVVVGAGPVGLTAALKLAKKGWRVHCVERWPSPYGLPRAVGLDPEGMRTLQGVGVADEQLAISGAIAGGTWENEEGKVLLRYPPISGMVGWPAVNICQPETEALLERHVRAEPSITLTRGVEAVGLDEDADGVTVQLRHTGTDRPAGEVRGRYLIGCDGAHSFVRAWLDVGVHDDGFFFDWYIVDLIPHGETPFGADLTQVCSWRRPTTLVPGGPGRRRWEFMLLPGETREQIDTEENAWRLLEPWGMNPGNATLERRAVYTFQARWAEEWNRGRVLLAGDAAHQMPPFAAQGLNSGLRDVENLAWKLDLVLAGASPRTLLDTYTIERREHVRHAIELSIELGKVICILDPERAAARDAVMLPAAGDPSGALPPVAEEVFRNGIVRHDGAGGSIPPAGTVAPQFEVRTVGGTGRFDDLFGPGTTLLTAADAPLEADLAERFGRLGGRSVVVREPGTPLTLPSEAEDLARGYLVELARLDAVAVLYRADGYYFGAARSVDDIPRLVEEFVHAVTADEAVSTHEEAGLLR